MSYDFARFACDDDYGHLVPTQHRRCQVETCQTILRSTNSTALCSVHLGQLHREELRKLELEAAQMAGSLTTSKLCRRGCGMLKHRGVCKGGPAQGGHRGVRRG